MKSCHFRGSYLELFRPNDELSDCFLADLNSLGVYLKLVRATFLNYFDIFEKKVLKKFFGSILTKSLPKSFTFQLEKVKNDENFRILQNASYGSEMTPERFRSVLRSRNTSFPPHNTPTHALKKFFQNRF